MVLCVHSVWIVGRQVGSACHIFTYSCVIALIFMPICPESVVSGHSGECWCSHGTVCWQCVDRRSASRQCLSHFTYSCVSALIFHSRCPESGECLCSLVPHHSFICESKEHCSNQKMLQVRKHDLESFTRGRIRYGSQISEIADQPLHCNPFQPRSGGSDLFLLVVYFE